MEKDETRSGAIRSRRVEYMAVVDFWCDADLICVVYGFLFLTPSAKLTHFPHHVLRFSVLLL